MKTIFNPPDFDEMMEISESIKKLTFAELSIKNEIKKQEAKTVLLVTGDSKFFVNGKAPAMNFIEATYKFTGAEKEILPLRRELEKVSSELDYYKRLFEIKSSMLSAWQTESSNNRKASF